MRLGTWPRPATGNNSTILASDGRIPVGHLAIGTPPQPTAWSPRPPETNANDMGLEDRQYYRSEYEYRGGHGSAGGQSIVNILLMINIGVFVADMFTGETLHAYLGLPSNLVQEPWRVYGLITYGFAHASWGSDTGIWHILMNMFMLWMFGREVESRLGRLEFLRFYLASVLIAGLVWLAYVNLVYPRPGLLVGASGAVWGVVALFIFNDPKRTLLLWFVLPVPAWLICAFIIIGSIVGMRGESHVAHEAHLAGIAFAAAYHYLGWNLGRLSPRGFSLSMPRMRKPNLRVHHPSETEDVESSYRQLEEEGDRILHKIQTQGEESLTDAERQTLERYSRRMRQKHR